MSKVVVTGGAGFIGSNLCEALVQKGYDVVAYDNFFLGKPENLKGINVKTIRGDILEFDKLNKACKGAVCIFNQAAASSSPMFIQDLKHAYAINIEGFINVLEAARKKNSSVVYASTSSVYGNKNELLREDMRIIPPNFYAASKLANEHLAMLFASQYSIRITGLRYMSVYGPHEKTKGIYANLVSQFLWDMQKDKAPVIYGNGKQTRDFTYVKDVAKANILAMESGIKSDIFNVGTGISHSLVDLIRILNKILGKNIKPQFIEIPVKNYISEQNADTRKAGKILGFKAQYSLEQGIREILTT